MIRESSVDPQRPVPATKVSSTVSPGLEVLWLICAVVSHSSAAVLLRLGDLVVRDVEFITTRRRTSRDPAVRLHHVTLAPYEVTWADGLPVTTATRTLVDLLAAGIAASHAGSFLAEALDRRMLGVGHVTSELASGNGMGFGRKYVRLLVCCRDGHVYTARVAGRGASAG